NELWLITNVSLTIHLTAASSQPRLASERSIVAEKTTKRFLKGLVENPGDVEDNTPVINVYSYNYPTDPDDVPPEYLIITSFDYAGYFQTLQQWKTSKGCKTDIIVLETDVYPNYQGVDDAEKLRNFLIDQKENNADFCYALIAGDVGIAPNPDIAPVRYTYYRDRNYVPTIDKLFISDLYFADIDGDWNADGDGVWGEPNDDQPDFGTDIYIGRVPIHNASDISKWIEKLARYEIEPGYGSDQYLSNVMISSADQMANTNQPQQIAACFSNFFNVDTETFREYPDGYCLYPTFPFEIDIINHLSSPSVGYYISLGHGSPDFYRVLACGYNCWRRSSDEQCSDPCLTSDMGINPDNLGYIGNVNNEGREYLHSSIACGVGAFDCHLHFGRDTCFAEKDLFVDGGSVAGTYNTRYGWVHCSCLLEKTRVDKLMDYTATENRFGLAHYATKVPYSGSLLDIVYSNNLFGDPEFSVYVDNPRNFLVDFPSNVELDSIQPVTIRVRDSYYGIGIPDVLVTLWKDDEIYERGFTNVTGYVNLTLNPQSHGTISIVCSKSKYIPFEGSIDINTYCADAVAGDVNGDGMVIGSDVIYAINYFRGSGPPPPDSCMCPDEYLY
ncbi:MAG: hypothetical protein J7K40_10845, partial [candidate division Zixibacteria bacterium]|nr:hypothetical protein [candidate division Zixibacteria bacterium]